ncbi:MAG: TetR family transcriptional regulator [Planctomycetes bacterium]|nr:TetR family transcriptional regulator [Planctomycetota bacterium]MCB9934310.1 TetR family transcriptional regulator [Planctomycetota bacterium]
MVRQHTGRKRDAVRTKAAILEAAIAEFALRGPAGTRVDEVAARAGVNKSLIYQYFGSKQELYAEALNAVLATITEKSAEFSRSLSGAQSEQDLRQMVRDYLEKHLALMESVPEWPRLLSWENLEGGRTLARLPLQQTYRAFLDRIRLVITPVAKRGLMPESLDVRYIAQAEMALTHFFVIQKGTFQHLFQMDPTEPQTRSAWLDYCTSLFMGAFRAPSQAPRQA